MYKQSSSSLWISTLAIVGLIVVSLGIARVFHKSRALYKNHRSEVTAHAIADSFKSAIEARVTMLRVLGKTGRLNNSDSDFRALAQTLINDFKDLYAVNLVSKDGIIQIAHPEKKNRDAIQRNIFEHPEAEQYLLASRNSQLPQMSHRLMTFQGIPAFTLYVPLLEENGELWGWLNAVVDFDSWLKAYLLQEDFKNVRVQLRWQSSPDTGVDFGPKSIGLDHKYSFNILNQLLHVEVGFGVTELELRNRRFYTLLMVFGGLLLGLIAMLFFKLTWSRQTLVETNSRLALSNSLLSSLTHDIANPLQTLSMAVENLADRKAEITPAKYEKINRSLRTLREMLSDARKLHAQGLGIEEIKTQPLILESALEKALDIVGVAAAKKHIEMVNDVGPSKSLVIADPTTLANNVLPNVLSNAIKFTPVGGKVRLYLEEKDRAVLLHCEDSGHGLSEKQIESFRRLFSVESKTGTEGEKGTGLGLLQIKILMEAYGGKVDLQNTQAGARLTLKFKKA